MFVVPMSSMRRFRIDCSVVVDPGCEDVRVTRIVPLPDAVTGNWPLNPTPEAMGPSVNGATDPPTLTL
jgi:hypothetical protein